MRKFNLLFTLMFALFTSGCALGPLVSHETARTVGDSNHELVAGYGMTSFSFKWNYGLSDDLDLGLQIEALSIGLRLKYAFLNSSKGWSLASALGVGQSIGGDHTYGDLLLSYKSGVIEPYLVARVVYVETDPLEFRDEDTGNVDFTITAFHYTYGQAMLGTRIWFNDHFLLSLEASKLFKISSGFQIHSPVFAGAALGYRF